MQSLISAVRWPITFSLLIKNDGLERNGGEKGGMGSRKSFSHFKPKSKQANKQTN
jgi:hypothetical protein